MEKKCRITPACAGSTTLFADISHVHWDHPRLRGEYYGVEVDFVNKKGSPPLARGVLIMSKPIRKVNRITPACAGSTKVQETAMQLH